MFTYKDVYVKQEYHNENLRTAEHRRLIREVTSAENSVLRSLYTNVANSIKQVYAGMRSKQATKEQMAGAAQVTPVLRKN